MPNYTYKCSGCDHVTEQIRDIADRDESRYCDECREDDETAHSKPKGKLIRQLIAPSFVLQGDGWHNQVYNKTRRRAGQ